MLSHRSSPDGGDYFERLSMARRERHHIRQLEHLGSTVALARRKWREPHPVRNPMAGLLCPLANNLFPKELLSEGSNKGTRGPVRYLWRAGVHYGDLSRCACTYKNCRSDLTEIQLWSLNRRSKLVSQTAAASTLAG